MESKINPMIKKKLDEITDEEAMKTFIRQIMELEIQHRDKKKWNYSERYQKLIDNALRKMKEDSDSS